MSSVRRWPPLPEEDRWAIELMEQLLEDGSQTPQELLARATKLRAEAAETDIRGVRDATLVLAERYEQAAGARLAST
jgi:uncharacterized protein YceH (UPF0502 family)